MTIRNALRVAYIFISGVALVFVFTIIMGAEDQSSADGINLSTLTSLITIASVLIGIGIFVQQTKKEKNVQVT